MASQVKSKLKVAQMREQEQQRKGYQETKRKDSERVRQRDAAPKEGE